MGRLYPDIAWTEGEPVVGQKYLVPTVEYPYARRLDAWPVFGPRHEDKEFINFPHLHYHVDFRFLTKAQEHAVFLYIREGWAKPKTVDEALALATSMPLSYGGAVKWPHPRPIHYPRRCRRARQPTFQEGVTVRNRYRDYKRTPAWAEPLRLAYAAHEVGYDAAGRPVCPHRGAPLHQVAPDADGYVTCPLHGLRWCLRTGRAAPPPAADATEGGPAA